MMNSDGQLPAVVASRPIEPLSKQLKELAGDAARRRLFDAVRAALRRSGMKQADVAIALGLSQSTVSRMLSAPSNLTVENAGRVAMATGCWLDFHTTPLKAPMYLRAEQVFSNYTTTIQPVVSITILRENDIKPLIVQATSQSSQNTYEIESAGNKNAIFAGVLIDA